MLKLWVLDADELYARCVEKSLTGELRTAVTYMGRMGSLRELKGLPGADFPDILIASESFYSHLPVAGRALSGDTDVLVTGFGERFIENFSPVNRRCAPLAKPFDAAALRSALGGILSARGSEDASEQSREKLESIERYIAAHLDADLSLEALSREIHYSSSYLSRTFKRHTGGSLSAYIKKARIERAKLLLANTDYQVQEIAEKVGMPKINTFGTVFKSETGFSPTQYRVRAAGGGSKT